MNDATPSAQRNVPQHLIGESGLFSRALAILNEGVQNRVFPGAAFAITHHAERIFGGAVGRFTYDQSSPEVRPETIFDLASLTKVLATTAMAMRLYEAGKLDLERRIGDILPEFVSGKQANDARRREITFRMLLAHSSGLPAYSRLFEQAHSREELLHAVYTMPLEAAPDSRAQYSDIGFILLGEALTRIAGETLDRYCAREIFQPLHMEESRFMPPPESRQQIPPTVNDQTFRHRVIQGEVHDENASMLGGVAGHAGLFSNVENVSKFALSMLRYGPPLFHPETIQLFTTRQQKPFGISRALGWDTPSPPSQSGKYFSSSSYGHLGYTGTSLWIDAERRISITLLTNRTWPDAQAQGIKQVRPRFYDAVMERLLEDTE